MQKNQRILLIDEKNPVETETALSAERFDVVRCNDLNIAISCYQLDQLSKNPFDVIIAVTDPAGQQRLKSLYRERFIDSLVLFQRSFNCSKGYCIDGHLARLCNPASVLSCVEDLQGDLKSRNQKPNLLENAFRQMIDSELNTRSCV